MNPAEPRAVLERLIVERREDYASLSRLLGKNSAYIQQFIRRGTPRRLGEQDRRTLAAYFGVSEEALGGPRSSSASLAELVPIPRFEVRASAGPGALDEAEVAGSPIGFDERYLKQLTNASRDSLSIIRVQGDSMFPTLSDEDDIMVDRSLAGRRISDGVYVLRREDTLMVKRLALNPSNRLVTISSDNTAYRSWPDCELGSIDIIGRVVWAGRKLR